MSQGATKQRKSRPVPVSDPLSDCSQWVTLKAVARNTEKALESLKERIGLLVPHKHGEAREYGPVQRLSDKGTVEQGHYLVQYITQDRRTVDNGKLTDLLLTKFGYKEAQHYMKSVADDVKVAPLLEDGTITKDELASCLVGSMPKYVQCEFKPD